MKGAFFDRVQEFTFEELDKKIRQFNRLFPSKVLSRMGPASLLVPLDVVPYKHVPAKALDSLNHLLDYNMPTYFQEPDFSLSFISTDGVQSYVLYRTGILRGSDVKHMLVSSLKIDSSMFDNYRRIASKYGEDPIILESMRKMSIPNVEKSAALGAGVVSLNLGDEQPRPTAGVDMSLISRNKDAYGIRRYTLLNLLSGVFFEQPLYPSAIHSSDERHLWDELRLQGLAYEGEYGLCMKDPRYKW